jgi:hypothetical protein
MPYLKTRISYRAVNTLRLGYKNQPVNVLLGKKSLFVLRSTQNTNTLCWQNLEVLYVSPYPANVVNIVSS